MNYFDEILKVLFINFFDISLDSSDESTSWIHKEFSCKTMWDVSKT